MSRTTLFSLLLILALGSASAASAEMSWGLAMQPDEEILAAVDALDRTPPPGADGAPAVFLLRDVGIDVLPGSHVLTLNWVVDVKNPVAVLGIASKFFLSAGGTVESGRAFVIRDGKISFHKLQISRGDGEIRRARLRVDVDDLREGDILGVSAITRFDDILYFEKVPVCAGLPTANFRLRVRCEEDHAYALKVENSSGVQTGGTEQIDGRTVQWEATAKGIAGVEGFRGAGPYAPGTPLVLVAESAEWLPAAGQWVSTLAWPRVALFLSGIREQSISSMIGAWERAPQIVAGAASDREKEEAIFRFVQEELELLVGDAYEPLGHRTADEIFDSGQATPMEQAMVMVTLLAASDLPGELAVVRTGEWGEPDPKFQSFSQFQDVAIVCGSADSPRYYVPYVDGAPAGSLPADWGTCWVLAPAPGLIAAASQAAAQVMGGSRLDVYDRFLELRKQSEEEGWFSLRKVEP